MMTERQSRAFMGSHSTSILNELWQVDQQHKVHKRMFFNRDDKKKFHTLKNRDHYLFNDSIFQFRREKRLFPVPPNATLKSSSKAAI